MMRAKRHSLVADIGATNARFALVSDTDSRLVEPRSLLVANYPGIADAIESYKQQSGLERLYRAVISVASPVTGEQLKMTNHDWSFSVHETRAALGLSKLKVINDYTALALALPVLDKDQCLQIGPGESLAGHPMAVLGPGTGLGVSGVVPRGDHWVPLESEGGHVSYGPANGRESLIIEVMREKLVHVSAESLVSGPGLSQIYAVITQLEHGAAKKLSPGEVSDLALKHDCKLATEALSIFCGILGTVAGNLALTLGARGGVYIGGGIVLKILEFFKQSSFRDRFEQHGRLTRYLQKIPTYVIDTYYPALTGAAVALDEEYEYLGVVSNDPGQS